ncbi:MAG: DUF6788 family protein [Candidatus Auribacterota bacterium]|nr:DUF6788 family protein [Candidatus Auribacterota bacterium]
MKTSKQSRKEVQQQLGEYQKKYEQIKARIQKIGFISTGSIIKRKLTCGNPNCRCHSDPKKLHGPYCQISWKENGKSVAYFLSPEKECVYRQWITNHRKLMAIIKEMLVISRRAGDCIRSQKTQKMRVERKGKKSQN